MKIDLICLKKIQNGTKCFLKLRHLFLLDKIFCRPQNRRKMFGCKSTSKFLLHTLSASKYIGPRFVLWYQGISTNVNPRKQGFVYQNHLRAQGILASPS